MPGISQEKVKLTKYLIDITKRTRVENVRKYTPNVIEPSFGIGRIFYCLLEHVYWHRPHDAARGVRSCFSFLEIHTDLNIPGSISAVRGSAYQSARCSFVEPP